MEGVSVARHLQRSRFGSTLLRLEDGTSLAPRPGSIVDIQDARRALDDAIHPAHADGFRGVPPRRQQPRQQQQRQQQQQARHRTNRADQERIDRWKQELEDNQLIAQQMRRRGYTEDQIRDWVSHADEVADNRLKRDTNASDTLPPLLEPWAQDPPILPPGQ